MAKKTLPARRQRPEDDDSLLIRSAESLGRMLGSLQRQLNAARLIAGKVQARAAGGDDHFAHGNGSGSDDKKAVGTHRSPRSAKSTVTRRKTVKRASGSASKSAAPIGPRVKRTRGKATSRRT